ncbi:MAG: hypothetical protein J6X66_13775 [Lachnospiraceae bacterium]|nr:hypothetical protein [Lachnospiraceae bacterium]
MNSTAEIMDAGINCLIEKLGTVETERFISVMIREKSDYTKWRQQHFADADPDEFHTAAVAYGKANPLT